MRKHQQTSRPNASHRTKGGSISPTPRRMHAAHSVRDSKSIASSTRRKGRSKSGKPLAQRFHEKYICNLQTGCWEWRASKHKDGYGQIGVDGRIELAHRVSYRLHYGETPSDYLRHTCDNPSCVNPQHLVPGNQSQNMEDRKARGRDGAYRIPAIDRRSRFQRPSLADRFREKFAVSADGCWIWHGARTSQGYGLIIDGKRRLQAHRASYELCNGRIPRNLVVRHKCDNPLCVNPAHLELGTRGDNVRDRGDRDRTARGSRSGKAVLNEGEACLIKKFLLRHRPVDGRKGLRVGPYPFLVRWFGVSTSVFWSIYSGETWGHVIVDGWDARKRDDGRVIDEHLARFVKRFLLRHPAQRGRNSGQCEFLSRWLNIPRHIVTNISRGNSWKHVTI